LAPRFSISKPLVSTGIRAAAITIKAVPNAEILNFGANGKFGYIRINSFNTMKAADEMRNALQNVQSKGVEGIILDLRDNPGGLIAQLVEVANMFVGDGILFSTVDSDGYRSAQVASSHNYAAMTLPVVVLINNKSAGASEVLSSVLRHCRHAKLVGEKSSGSGVITAINPMGDGSGIVVSIAKFATPENKDFHKVGITPDYVVRLTQHDREAGKKDSGGPIQA
jgi:carboxyl-terminal processing protease